MDELGYGPGDRIGDRFEVIGFLGKGGFGVVYHVRDRLDDDCDYALKTCKGELICSPAILRSFKKEALTWVGLGRHEFILEAVAVHEFSGRLFVSMQYIAPDEDGLVTLQDHIAHHRTNISDRLIGLWAIEFCHGIAHAYAHGITAHRDIKPNNILIGPGAFVKIADFGLSAAIGTSEFDRSHLAHFGYDMVRTEGHTICGTLGYIAPELYEGGSAAVSSDIYSFGMTLWQLCAGSPRPPLWEALRVSSGIEGTRSIIASSRIPALKSIYWPVISRCLELNPERRFRSFDAIREEVKAIAARTGLRLDFIVNTAPTFGHLVNRGASLGVLGRLDEAVATYEEAIRIEPNDARVWVNKGNLLSRLGRLIESMQAYDRAVALDPDYDMAWFNKAALLRKMGRDDEALSCFERTIALNPRHFAAWRRKATLLSDRGDFQGALDSYKVAIDLDPKNAVAWTSLANMLLDGVGNPTDALKCYDRALSLEREHMDALRGKAKCLIELDQPEEAFAFLDQVLAADPYDLEALNTKAVGLCKAQRQGEAIPIFDSLLAQCEAQGDVLWTNKGNALLELGHAARAIECFERALAINGQYVSAILQMEVAQRQLE